MATTADDLIDYLKKHNNHDWAAMVAALKSSNEKMQAEHDGLKKRVVEAESANELDRSRIPVAMTELNAAVRSRDWVLDGRGPYSWDDDDYRAEFSLWVQDVKKAVTFFARIASDWHGCPMDQAEIRHARAALEQQS